MLRSASLTCLEPYACRCHELRLSAFNKETTYLLTTMIAM